MAPPPPTTTTTMMGGSGLRVSPSPSPSLLAPNLHCKSPSYSPPLLVIASGSSGGNAVKQRRLRLVPAALSIEADTSASASASAPTPSSSSGGPFRVLAGQPQPLGATASDAGVNFALYSGTAIAVSLCLFTLPDLQAGKASLVIPLHPERNRTGHVWHLLLSPAPPKQDQDPDPGPDRDQDPAPPHLHDLLYGFQVDGHSCPQQGRFFDLSAILLDPYAKAVLSRQHYGLPPSPPASCWPPMAAMIPSPSHDHFDWQGDVPLHLPQKDLLIYEMHIRGFTNHDSSNAHHPGTYAAATQKLHHLKDLGINCIELMPCHEFNELEYFDYSPVMGQKK